LIKSQTACNEKSTSIKILQEPAMRRSSLFAAALLLFFCATGANAPAAPDKAGQSAPLNQEERFKGMDKNNDGSLSPEEFFERFPAMHEAAFKGIDKNGDNAVSLEEWLNFSSSHSRDMGSSGMGSMMRNPTGGGAVMREMFKEDGDAASGGAKNRPLFEMKPKDGSAKQRSEEPGTRF
jgi:hypothetical protein